MERKLKVNDRVCRKADTRDVGVVLNVTLDMIVYVRWDGTNALEYAYAPDLRKMARR
jgi:hypothetical protein